MSELALLVLGCAAATYLWRGLGVALSGKLRAESELFQWISCVAYAMIAALVSRIVIMPTGLAAQSALSERLIACAVALAAYYATRHNLFLGVAAGVLALVAFGYARGL